MSLEVVATAAALALTAATGNAQGSFVNWETPHVHPLDSTPNGERLLAVNTADARLEVFRIHTDLGLVPETSVPVGLDPVSVRARTEVEVWVVNQISDSVSLVDLETGHVVRTLATEDEPADVAFAAGRAFVSCSQANTVLVFDLHDLDAAPVRLDLRGEDPRALAVDRERGRVYVAFFESGNGSTILSGGRVSGPAAMPDAVNHSDGPYGGANPPPNAGDRFEPELAPGLPPPPPVSLIVKRDAEGRWLDDNGGDWTELVSGEKASLSGRPVGWRLLDHDLGVIDAETLEVTYVEGLMNLVMDVAVNPRTGRVAVVGTDATNEVRYAPNLNGVFLRVVASLVGPTAGAPRETVDLNPHVDYASSSVAVEERERSLGDPRGIAWNAEGTRAYVSGMGSNNLVVLDAEGQRAGLTPTIEVGQGPTGVVFDERRARVYVLNRFDASISVVSAGPEVEIARVRFHDATPDAIKLGRPLLYDTHGRSGTGLVACASCHPDARMDKLAWDLGDPRGELKSPVGQNLGSGQNWTSPSLLVGFQDWHPMKGPMLTQTLQDIIGKEPFHWRGDRDGIEEFAGTFVDLLGAEAPPDAAEMQALEDFLATIAYPPNPFRELDNKLSTDVPLPGQFATGDFGPAGAPLPDGDAQRGRRIFRDGFASGTAFYCVSCHPMPIGVGSDFEQSSVSFTQFDRLPAGPNGERHHALFANGGQSNRTMKAVQLRNLYERTGFELARDESLAGFGYRHDSSAPSVQHVLGRRFDNAIAVNDDQEVADLLAYLFSISGETRRSKPDIGKPPGTFGLATHAGVGAQLTLAGPASTAAAARLSRMVALADSDAVGLIVKGLVDGEPRGWAYLGDGLLQSDRAAETATTAELMAAATPGAELTWTLVPEGSELRLGIDRDEDGILDGDELLVVGTAHRFTGLTGLTGLTELTGPRTLGPRK